MLIHQYSTNLYVENIFLPLFHGKPVALGYTIISLPHLVDIINLSVLLSPLLLPVLAFSAGSIRRRILKKETNAFLLWVTAGGLLFLVIIDPKLGMPRDWDLFSLAFFAPTLLSVSLLSEKATVCIRQMIIPFFVHAFMIVILILAVNLDTARSIRQMEYQIDLDRSKSLQGMVILRNYLIENDRPEYADSLNTLIQVYYPHAMNLQRVGMALENNDIRAAEIIFSTIRPDRFYSGYYDIKANLQYLRGDMLGAMDAINNAIELQKYNHEYYARRALFYFNLKQYDYAMIDLRRGLSLKGDNPDILRIMASIHLRKKNVDSAVIYTEKLIEADSANPAGYYFLAQYYASKHNIARAVEYHDLYFKYIPASSHDSPEARKLVEIIDRLLNVENQD